MRAKRMKNMERTEGAEPSFNEIIDVSDDMRRRRGCRRKTVAMRVSAALLIVISICIGGFPAMLQYRSAHELSNTSDRSARTVAGWPYPQADDAIAAAKEYNERLATSGQPILGEAKDPFSQVQGSSRSSESGSNESDSASAKDTEYQSLLDSGSGVMGTIRIPKISVKLPIYHGTSQSALASGAGHLYGSSLPVGDTVDFTVAADVPHAAAGWDAYPFTITDTASKGLRIAETSDFKVQFKDQTTVNPDLYTITQKGNAQSGTTTTIYFADATTLAGRTIVVSYQGTVTKDALDGLSGSVDNKATITTKDGTSGEGKTVLKTYGFQFTKIGKEGNEAKPLAGAKFVVKNAEGKFLKQAEDGAWSFVSDQNDAKTFITENDGLVKVAGLAAGTYTVVETQAPTDYAQNFRVTFNVEITDEGLVTFEQDALRQVQPNNNTTANATATVLNVKNVTQLPLTGAAGTVLFTVVALLVGGAGVAVAVKSRRRTY